MRLRTLIPALTVLLPIYAACSQLPPDESNLGATGMKLSTDIDGNTDVSAFDFTFTRVSCAGEVVIPWETHKVEDLADAHLTGGADVPGNVLAVGAAHLFADRFQPLAAGCYDVTAQPLNNVGMSSVDCASAVAKHVQVTDGQTAEVTLYSQCNGGDATGFIDALGILNHRPFVNDLTISPSKFVNLCPGTTPTQTLCATARDKDHDPITFTWQQTSGPAVQSGPTVKSTSEPDANGNVTQCVDVVLSAAAKATFAVTVYDMVKDPNGPGYITFDQLYAQNGYPYTSHWTGNFPLYGLDDPSLCGSGSSASSSSSSSSGSGGASSSSSTASSSSSSSSGSGGATSSSSSTGGGCVGGALYCSGYSQQQDYGGSGCVPYTQVIQTCSAQCGAPGAGSSIGQTCAGTALVGTYNDGNCGAYTQVIQACSAQCGAPGAGSQISQTCVGANLVGTYNDGNCGTYTQVIQVNSPSCPVVATCSDGIKNQNETGIDCGGSCAPCGPVCGDGTCDPGETCGTCTADCPMPTQYSIGYCVGTSWVYHYGFNGCWALSHIQTYDDSSGLACGSGGFSGPTTVCDTVLTITLPEAEACGGSCTGSVGGAPCDCNWLGSYSQAGSGQQPGSATPVCN